MMVFQISKSVKNKMIHWAQSAKRRTLISQKPLIQSLDRHPENFPVTEPENFDSHHQHDTSKPIINPSDSKTQIHIENDAFEKIETETFDNGYLEDTQLTKLVNMAKKIEAAMQLTDLANAANKVVQKEASSLQHDLLNSVNQGVEKEVVSLQHEIPAIPKREIDLENINDVLDADEKQIRIQDIKDTDEDINRIICLFFSLVAVIGLLSMFVGGIVLWEKKFKPGWTPCIEVVIGDGVCDDRQNVAECNYDGQDCCLATVNTSFCEDCRCHLGKCSKLSRRQ
jgi:hypothetical protein